MHYIRLLRPATINTSDSNRPVLAVLFTITTDLGDTFLYPDEPLELAVGWEEKERVISEKEEEEEEGEEGDKPQPPQAPNRLLQAVDQRPVLWKPGMRALNAKFYLEKKMLLHDDGIVTIGVLEGGKKQPKKKTVVAFTKTLDLLPWRVRQSGLESDGLVAPVSFEIHRGGVPAEESLRRYLCPRKRSPPGVATMMEIGEDIGESIARHVWDAGLVTAAYIDNARGRDETCHSPDPIPISSDTGEQQQQEQEQNILEIGCGVGILGIGIANSNISKQSEAAATRVNVLLTDLPEAEERAKANIERWEKNHNNRRRRKTNDGRQTGEKITLDFESLDWDEGRRGVLGPKIRERKKWDYIVLSDCTYNVDAFPSLVGTLSALHRHHLDMAVVAVVDNSSEEDDYDDDVTEKVTTKVILSTKRRHDSEEVLFDMLASEGWTHRLLRKIELPRLGIGGGGEKEDETVELYALEKKGRERRKRKAAASQQQQEGEGTKGDDDDDDQPSKRSAR